LPAFRCPREKNVPNPQARVPPGQAEQRAARRNLDVVGVRTKRQH